MAKTHGPTTTAARAWRPWQVSSSQLESLQEYSVGPPWRQTLPATSPHLPLSLTLPATCPLPPVSSQHSNCRSPSLPQSPITVSCASTHPSYLLVSRSPFLLPLPPIPKPLLPLPAPSKFSLLLSLFLILVLLFLPLN